MGAKRVSSPYFILVAPREVRGYAVVIPKKIIKGAVDRHLLKRRVLSALRQLELPEALVVFPKADASELAFEGLRGELAALVSKLNK